MKKLLLMTCFLFFLEMFPAPCVPCTLGPNGINQWRLIYQVGECVNTSAEILCSKIDALGSCVDTGCCSELESLIVSMSDVIVSDIETVSSKIDALSSESDACCSKLESILDNLVVTASCNDGPVLSSIDFCCSKIDKQIDSSTDIISSEIDACCSLLESELSSISDVLSTQGDACCSKLESLIVSSTDVIVSDVDSVSSKIDALSSKSDACCSLLESELISISDVLSTKGDACCSVLESLIVSTSDVIVSDVDSVSSKIDVLSSKSDACCSLLESELISISDVLSTKGDACCSVLESLIVSTSDVIVSDVDSVSSKIDVLSSKSDACCSLLESELISISDVLSTKGDACCSVLESLIVSTSDVIVSDVDSVSSKIDVLSSKSDACCSLLESELISISDVLSTKGDACCSVLESLIVSTSDVIVSDVESVSSKIDVLSSKSDACCSLLESELSSISDVLSTQGDVCCSVLESLIVSSTDVIVSDVESVSSKIDALSSGSDACCSKLESILDNLVVTASCNDGPVLSSIDFCCSKIDQQIDSSTDFVSSELDACCTNLESRLDVLASKTMLLDSILDVIANQPQGFISCFGDALSVGRQEYISFNFQYGVGSYDTTTVTANGGALLTTNSMVTLSSGVNAAGAASLESKRYLQYRPGHQGYAFFTAGFLNGGKASSKQWIGLFDASDGMAVGFNNTLFSVLFRTNSVDTIIPQSSFNVDTLNGSGPSGILLDPKKINIFRLAYGWLGVATLQYQIFRSDCTWHTFHEIAFANSTVTPHFSNPVVPMRAEVTNTGNATDIRLATASWNAGVLGDFSHVGQRVFTVSNSTGKSISTGNTGVPILSIRNNTTFNALVNHIEARLYGFGGGDFGPGNSRLVLRVLKNPTLTGAVFNNVNAGNSIMSFDTAATVATGGTLVLISPAMNGSSGPLVNYLTDDDVDIYLLPGDILTIVADANTGAGGSDVRGVFTWAENF